MNKKTAIIAMMNGEVIKFQCGTLYRFNEATKKAEYSTNNGKTWYAYDYGFNTDKFSGALSLWEQPKKIVAFKFDSDGAIIFAEENSDRFHTIKANCRYTEIELTNELMIAATNK